MIDCRLRNSSQKTASSASSSSSSGGSSENTPSDKSERNPLDPLIDDDFDGTSDDEDELVDNASERDSCEDEEEDDDHDIDDGQEEENPDEIDGKPARWFENENSLVVKALKDFQKQLVEAEKDYAKNDQKCKNSIIKSLMNGNMWFHSVCSGSEAAFASNWVNNRDPSPTPFYGKQIFVFAPHLTFKDVQVCCYHCGEKCTVSPPQGEHRDKTKIRLKGWTASPRKCYGRDDIIYVFTRVYQCFGCKDNGENPRKLYSYKPAFLAGLPWHVQRNFPFFFTHRSGIETSLFQDLISLMETSSGIAGFRKIMKERYMLRHTHLELSFYSCLKHYKNKPNGAQYGLHEVKMTEDRLKSIPSFSQFNNPDGYYGQIPSRKY